MRTARRDTLLLVVLLTTTLALSGCSGKKWYWPFGKSKKADGTPTAAVMTTDAPAGYADSNFAQDTAPPVPPVTDYETAAAPATIAGPGGVIAPDEAGSLPAAKEILREPASPLTDLQMVHFAYDRSEITGDARTTLDQNIEWLLQHPGLQVQIEGHCDERGTVEYNLSLGQRRADSVREYLVGKGIDPNSLHTISYGKERPMAFGASESDHALNRRAQFLVFSE